MLRTHSAIHEVTSATNTVLKIYRRALADGETREGWLAVEGPHLVEDALNAAARARVESVLVSQSGKGRFARLMNRLSAEAEVTLVPDRLFRQVAQTQSPQGMAALVQLAPASLETLLGVPNALLVVACGLQDPGNLGTLMRSAEALGATGLLNLQDTVSPFNPKVVRASAGAIFRLPVVTKLELPGVLPALRAANVSVIASDRHSSLTLTQADLRGPVAILIGREASGLPPEALHQATRRLSIPIRNGTDSVNAASAATIFLYEAARQRGFVY
jgi:RNA methyltransferase, TrmH family